MGQIVVSIFIGGWMVLLGLFMNAYLTREERSYKKSSQEEV